MTHKHKRRKEDAAATSSMLERCRVAATDGSSGTGKYELFDCAALRTEISYLRTEIRLLRRALDAAHDAAAPRWLHIDEESIDSDTDLGRILFEGGWADGQSHPVDTLDSIFKPENHEDEPCDGCGKRPSVSQGHGSFICRPCQEALPERPKQNEDGAK